jgi:hypothetical protein
MRFELLHEMLVMVWYSKPVTVDVILPLLFNFGQYLQIVLLQKLKPLLFAGVRLELLFCLVSPFLLPWCTPEVLGCAINGFWIPLVTKFKMDVCFIGLG